MKAVYYFFLPPLIGCDCLQSLLALFCALHVDVLTFSAENYFLALCESERKTELLMLLDIIDITKISSVGHLGTVFRSLARLLLESFMKKFILALKSCGMSGSFHN